MNTNTNMALLKEEDKASLDAVLAVIAEAADEARAIIEQNVAHRIPRADPRCSLNQIRRYATRLREGSIHRDWSPEKRAAVACVMERSVHQEELLSALHVAMRAVRRFAKDVMNEYESESREVEGATVQLVKEAAREERDAETIREVNRLRRRAGRSRRK
jgi:hypothetical protein